MRELRITLTLLGLLCASFYVSQMEQLPRAEAMEKLSGFNLTGNWLERRDRLVRLELLSRVLRHIQEGYVDPKRVDPSAMFERAIEQVSLGVPEVRVLHPEAHKSILLVDQARMEFDTDLPTLFSVQSALSDALKFIRSNRKSEISDRDLEIAAINGVLSTLDPHSAFLSEDLYKETKVGTSGKFGGVGIVIGIRDNKLTIIAPLDGTPAARAGLRAGDTITQIGEESTVNMSLTEAVDKMRGPKGIPVTIVIRREGWTEPKSFTIVRDVIEVVSVESQLLPERVGYVKIKNFQGQTSRDLAFHLEKMTKTAGGSLRGLILDLRNNPGGLLDQAIAVSDKFLKDGAIVTTVGYSNTRREEEEATAPGTEPDYPIAILVNEGSASASEIVAGALQRRNRAIVIGRKTFGKGTVQSIYDLPENTALKLTIAQYLTPGDFSIQTIGIVPDVRVVPALVTDEVLDIHRSQKERGEISLERHFNRPDKPEEPGKSAVEMHYLENRNQKQLTEETDSLQSPKGGETEKIAQYLKDFEIESAHELLQSSLQGSDRAPLIAAARDLAAALNRREAQKIAQALTSYGINWSPPSGPPSGTSCGTPTASVEFTPRTPIRAGTAIEFAVTVENPGPCTLYQTWAQVESKNYLFNDREFLFGRLSPAQKIRRQVKVEVPKPTPDNLAPIEVTFHEALGRVPARKNLQLAISAAEPPRFALNYRFDDRTSRTLKGNGNGLPEEGENVEIHLNVRNTGSGASGEVSASLKALPEGAIFLKRGRAPLPVLKPGQEASATFAFEVRKATPEDPLRLELIVNDSTFRTYVARKIQLPPLSIPKASASPTVAIRNAPVLLRPFPEKGEPPMAVLEIPMQLKTGISVGGFQQVDLGSIGRAWVPSENVILSQKTTPTASPKIRWNFVQPPSLSTSIEKTALQVTAGQFVPVSGNLSDPSGIRDVYIFANGKKVYYASFLKNGAAPTEAAFETSIPLEAGINRILMVGRNTYDLRAQRPFVLYREGAPAGGEAAVAAGEGSEGVDDFLGEAFLIDPSVP